MGIRNALKDSFGFGGGVESQPIAPAQAPRSTVSRLSAVPRSLRRNNDATSVRTLNPTSFNDAGDIAYYYRNGVAVIVNLDNADLPTRRRLVDFMAGLKEAMEGQIRRVTETVYLVTPQHMLVDDGEDDVSFDENGGGNDGGLIIPVV